MRFGWVTLNVSDMNKSVEFYTSMVGLKMDRRFKPMPGTEIAFLSNGANETEVELIENAGNKNPNYGKDISLGFEVPSLDGTIQELGKKNIGFRGPFQPGPMIRFVYAEDPDGAQIQFFENTVKK